MDGTIYNSRSDSNRWKGGGATPQSLGSTAKKIGSREQNFVSLVSFFGQRSELILKMGIMENKKESTGCCSTPEIKMVEGLVIKLRW